MAGRLQIAVGEVAGSADELSPGVRALIDSADEIMVIAPRLPGRLDWLASDTDRATAQADERLAAVVGQLEAAGHTASGRIGAEILCWLSRTPCARAGRLLEGLLERFGLALTVFEIGG